MGLPDLVLDFVPLSALGLVDLESLVEVVGSGVLLRQIVHWFLDEGEVHPDPGLFDVHVNRLLDDLLLEAFLKADCF